MDVGLALFLLLAGCIVVGDSLRVGIAWASDGPKAGYFPFYIGLILIGSSLVTIYSALTAGNDGGGFVERGQLRSVLQVLLPAAVFVGLIELLGIYLAGALYIGAFMTWIGRYPPWKTVPVAVLAPLVLFVTFEVWFLVPLPKGPVEALLGF